MRKGRRNAGLLAVGVALAGLVGLGSLPGPAAATPQGEIAEVAEAIGGQYIVTLAPDSGPDVAETARSLAAAHHGRLLFIYRTALRGFAVAMSEEDALALSAEPAVARVEENGRVRVSTTQTDPTWGLDRIDQAECCTSGTYDYDNNGVGVRVYLMDTGVRRTHTEFGGRASAGYSAIRDGRGSNDCNGHGTHVAGTVGGATYGVAKGVRIVPVRVLGCAGGGSNATIIAGVDWVTAHAVRPAVANMSLGGYRTASIDDAVTRSIRRGITYVVAAGNESSKACNTSPARVPQAITVGAADDADVEADFSNYGSCLDLYAPGVDVVSAGRASDTATATQSGTSMASPHVAGVAARYLQLNPGASPATVARALRNNSLTGRLVRLNGTSPDRLLYSRFLEGVAPPPPGPPANDAYAGAVPITGTTGQIRFVNRRATTEAGEAPLPSTQSAGRTVWFAWTAPSDMLIYFNTCTTDFDDVLAVYGGSSPAPANEWFHDDSNSYCTWGGGSSVLFSVTAGQVIHLSVDGTTGDPEGASTLRWHPYS